MRPLPHKPLGPNAEKGFTLAEVLIASAVCAMFGLAAFATNERLLVALKTQKETTAANMMLQERMETFRSFSYSNVADTSYVSTNVVQKPTTSEAPLGRLTEQITVSWYATAAGGAGYPSDGSTPNQWTRNSTYPTGHQIYSNASLATSYTLLRVDILLTWTSANGRIRTRDLAAIFGKGNIAP
jgi:prepilin-type N-terminal cleavage/methylation domain-containing protein